MKFQPKSPVYSGYEMIQPLSVGCKYEYMYSRSSYYSNATSTKE